MAWMPDLTRRDTNIIGGMVAVLLGASVVGHVGRLYQQFGPQLELVTEGLVVLAGIVLLYYLYQVNQTFGGVVGRSTAFIGIGYGFLAITAVFHIYFHLYSPEFIGYFTLQHTGQAWAMFFVTYGLYLLYVEGGGGGE